jgi:hypothetical protein
MQTRRPLFPKTPRQADRQRPADNRRACATILPHLPCRKDVAAPGGPMSPLFEFLAVTRVNGAAAHRGAGITDSVTFAAELSSTLTLVPLYGIRSSIADEGKRPSTRSKAAM